MKIVLNGLVLADSSVRLPPLNLVLNGSRVVEVVDFGRATSKGIFARGGTANSLSFGISKALPTLAEAEAYLFGLEAAAPTAGVLTIRATGGAATFTAPSAALAGIQSVRAGLRVDTVFTLTTGRFQAGQIPGLFFDPDTPNTMIIRPDVPNGASVVPVVFPAAVANPAITGMALETPTGANSPGIRSTEQLTPNGVTIVLTAPVPTAGFRLHLEIKTAP